MGFNCVVTIKQVPDTKAVTAKAMQDDGTVNRAALPAIFNPEDLNALEAALQVKDLYGGTVTVITMGPPKACEVLRDALYRGADRAILLSDAKAAASDTLSTSYILNCAVRKLGKVDLVFCGRQAIDGDTAQVGPQMAEKLEFPQITYMEELQGIKNGVITVKRNTGHGWQVVSCKLPALVTVMDTANVPRYPAAKNMMKYKKARSAVELGAAAEAELPKLREKGLELEVWDLAKIDADLQWCGRKGSPTKVHRIQSVVLKGGDRRTIEPTEDGIKSLVHELIEDHTLG